MSTSRRFQFHRILLGSLAGCGGLALAMSSAMAQAEGQGVQPDAEADMAIGDIVVTAQKRSESASRVGISITAIGGEDLQNRGIRNVADLANSTPGLTFSQTDTSTPVYTLRGVGFYENSLAAYPAVSVYVDEVPLAFPALTTGAGMDLERLEVLKGPQGILFGQNSTGGAINYIAKKPTADFEAGLTVGYARFDDFTAEGYISGPLSDAVRARLSFSGEHSGDWQYSYTRNDSLGKTRKMAARLLLDMDASDRLRFELNVNGWINKSDPQAPQAFEFDPIVLPAVSAFVTGNPNNNAAILSTLPLSPQKARAADWTPGLPKGDERMGQIALRGTYEFSDDILLTSITAYTAYKRRNQVDTDGYAVAAFDQDAVDGDITSFTQELRISNDAGEPLRWMIGGNYEHSKVDEYANSFYPDASTIDFFIALFPAGAGWIGNSYFSNQKMDNYAAFGNLEYDIDPDLTVKLGGRYTHTKRAVDQCTNDQGDGKWAAIVDGLNGYAARGIPLLAPGACTTAEPNPNPGPDFGNPIPITGFQDVLKEHNFSWRIGLDYKPTPTTLIYANLSQGYKTGSFPNVVATRVEQMAPVTQERLLAAEVGVKKRLLNNRASITAAAYYYDYSDKQIRSGIFIAPYGVLDKLTNIPKSSIRGAELELAVRPVPGLSLTASGTFTDARIDRFIGIDDSGNAVNFAGTDIPYNSKWAATGIAEYEWDVSDSLKASLGATLSYRSKSAGALGSAGDTTLNAYTILDLRAGIGALDDKWRVQFWGKNVTNKYYWLNTVHAFDNNVRYAARPVTYGVSVSFKY